MIEEQPIVATAAAAGVGFLVGSRLARPTMALLMSTATRVAVSWIGEAIQQAALEERKAHHATTEPNTGGQRS